MNLGAASSANTAPQAGGAASAVFRYVDDPHGYFLGDQELPSPSSVFQDLGLVDPRWFTKESRERGRAVHAGIHYALKGTLDWSTLHPDLHGYVKSGLLFVERRKPVIRRMEKPLYHPELLFAGTSDIEWELDSRLWIVDWKSGKAPKVARYQTAAYEMLARAQDFREDPEKYEVKHRIFRRAALELQEDGSIANLVPFDDYTDGAGWLNLLGAYRIRQSQRSSKPIEMTKGENNHVAYH